MNIKKSYILSAAMLLTLGACSEGQYWTEPESVGQTVSFAKPMVNVVVPVDGTMPDSYDIIVNRTDATAPLTVNVEVNTKYPDQISGPETLTFAAGSYTATYTLSFKDLLPGVPYSASVEVEETGGLIQPSDDNMSFSFRMSKLLKWKAAGTATVYSFAWVADEDGNPGVATGVVVEEGNWPIAGERIFRLNDLYNKLEPDNAEAGAPIMFFTDDEGNPLRLYADWQYMGESDDEAFYYFGTDPALFPLQFELEDGVYYIDALVGTAEKLDGPVTPGWYESIAFKWTCPAK